MRSGIPDHAIYDQAGVEEIGAWIASRLRPGDAVLLSGPLGAGKSTLARALIRAACGDPALEVPSPSYTLVQSFEVPGPQSLTIHHFDLWRLDGPEPLAELGWDDALAGVVLVEWPDRLGSLMPDDGLSIELVPAGPGTRSLTVTGWEERR